MFRGAIQASNALVISDNRAFRNIDVHGTTVIAQLAVDAGGCIAPDFEDSNQVGNADKSAVWTGIFTPRAFYEQGPNYGYAENSQRTDSHFAAPEIKESKIRIHFLENNPSGDSRRIYHPAQHYIAQIAQVFIDANRNKTIILFLENFAADFTHPFLERTKRADPTAEYSTKDYREHNDDIHEQQGRFMHFFNDGSGGHILVYSLHRQMDTGRAGKR